MKTAGPSVSLLGIRVSVIDPPGVIDEIARRRSGPGCALINNVNIHACNLAVEQPEFRRILNESAVVFCDGYGVKLGARLLGHRLGARMTPPDWIDALFRRGASEGWSFFFVGDRADVVGRFAAESARRHPGLTIAGWESGYFDLDGEENRNLIVRLAVLQPDVILTGMGMPRQEIWAARAARQLPRGVWVATGALFRWYIGEERRAPRVLRELGGEGLYRLLRHPVRHFRRYALGVPKFFFRILRERIRRSTGEPS
ncbi:MAG: WecB/TagA/CpsF family glycosyltransferase [Kiritimatiellia bacterium]|nr:WecB/TagA/CpsF family glycosyltransferase [Kiritimatiellia bacterium]